MPGSFIPAEYPKPLRVFARAVAVATLVIGMCQHFERRIVSALVPAFTTAIWVLDDTFVVTDVALSPEDSNATLRLRANLARPLKLSGNTLYPFGWYGVVPDGRIQVSCALGGVLLYPALMLILILVWPGGPKELLLRVIVFLPLALVTVLVDTPSTVLAELWNSIGNMVTPRSVSGWVVWSRFLMGGGGLTVGIVAAATDILLVKRYCTRSRLRPRDWGSRVAA
jgi:hypothetical protein